MTAPPRKLRDHSHPRNQPWTRPPSVTASAKGPYPFILARRMPYRQTAARFTPEPKWMASKLQGEETRAGPLAHGTLQTSTIVVCGSAAPKGRELPATSAEAREAAKSRSKASAGFAGAQCSHQNVYRCHRRGEPDPLSPRRSRARQGTPQPTRELPIGT